MAEVMEKAPASALSQALVNLTEGAAAEVKRIIAENKIPEGYKLRVGVTGGGCSGLSYALGFDQQKENDELFTSNGVEILLDKRHAIYLAGTTIDYQDGLQGRGFTFDNPNAKKTCGCGSSFSA
ncbi:MAG: iron-sulfur cluster assembly accessory protein [Chloroherpetonaceae bacterium]|nr:iron-sulfur cluster assembly accessory protein [Chloroherpetonaceae bacterium]